MATPRPIREVRWLKAARRDFEEFPAEAQDRLRLALEQVAIGAFPDFAKLLTGFGPGVLELALPHR